MPNFNQFIGMGHLTKDPECKSTSTGALMCKFSIGINEKGKDGQERTDFVNCVTWNQTAQFMSNYLHKGDAIHVAGKLRQNSYTDKNGEKRTTYEVWAQSVTSLGSKRSGGATQGAVYGGSPQSGATGWDRNGDDVQPRSARAQRQEQYTPPAEEPDSDIPF